jgi:hypothetical protein
MRGYGDSNVATKAVKQAQKKTLKLTVKRENAEKTNGKKRQPKPGEWRTVLRLPEPTAKKLKAAVKKINVEIKEANDGRLPMSINSTIQTLLDTWTEGEGS